MKVALVYGGTSTEQEASTLNAQFVEAALKRLGYRTDMIVYDGAMIERLRSAAPDAVFLCVQGKWHGDGTSQAVLDFLGLPYTGSGAMAAAIINNKIVCKELFQYAGLRTPSWQVLSHADYKAEKYDFSPIGYPFVAKAPTQGGGNGIAFIKSSRDISKIEDVFSYDDPILIEQFIPGLYTTAGFLAREGQLTVFPSVLVITGNPPPESELNTYNGLSFTVCKSDFPEAVQAEIEAVVRKAFEITRAKDYGRLDFIISKEDGLPYLLEINAVPSLKPSSIFPQIALLYGIDYDKLIETVLLNGLNNPFRNKRRGIAPGFLTGNERG